MSNFQVRPLNPPRTGDSKTQNPQKLGGWGALRSIRGLSPGTVLQASLLGIGVSFFLVASSSLAQAAEPETRELTYPEPTSQLALSPTPVVSVDQLTDIKPTDWAYEALKSLVEKYQCIQGDRHLTFQGNRVLSRDELAAGLSSCLAYIESTFAPKQGEVSSDDLATIQRLQADFAKELANVSGRVTSLEARTTSLASQQFSTTTQLRGEAVFALVATNAADPDKPNSGSQVTVSNRLRLTLNTSFTGKDMLITRIQAGNVPRFDRLADTDMVRLAFDSDTNNQFELDTLQYRFPIGNRITVYANAQASSDDFADTLNPLFDSSGRGALSRFGRRNPIYRLVGSTGLGADFDPAKWITLSVGYLADRARDPQVGLLSRPFGAIAQIAIRPNRKLEMGLTYLRTENSVDTGTGSDLANRPFRRRSSNVRANSFGFQMNAKLHRYLVLGGWVGYTSAVASDLADQPQASILNYAVTIAIPNLGGKGNLGGIIFGQPPKVMQNDLGRRFEDSATSFHLEAFYRLQISDSIFITPGLFVATAPDHDSDRSPIVMGILRTTFRF